jgi:hypothetical protein
MKIESSFSIFLKTISKRRYSLALLTIFILHLGGCCPPFCPPPPPEPDGKTRLSPPTVNEPLYACATAVTVEGYVPRAKIDIYANGTTLIGGGISDSPWGQSFSVNPPLSVGQRITATQTFGSDTSSQSKEVVVVSFFEIHPEGLPKPNLKTPLYNCGGAIAVHNLGPGGLLQVYADGNSVGKVDGCGAGQWLFVTPQFVKDQKVYANEKLCETTGPKSDEATVLEAPSSLPAPTVEEVYEGGKYCTVNNITNGAMVEMYNGTLKIAGHYCSGGGQVFRLNPQPAAGDRLTATQKLCDIRSDSSDPTVVKPCSELPAPKVLPVCIGNEYVIITGAVIDSRILIYADGSLIGNGGGTKINLFRPVVAGEKITATQSLGTCTSAASVPVEVKSGGAPPYEPAYWNDPSIVTCNNCYNYGCNIRTDNYAQVGYAHGVSPSINCPSVGNAAKADGLTGTIKEKTCSGCTHLVALVIDPYYPDYHWYRLDDTGRWSHKLGPHPTTNLDASDNLITNPETANRDYSEDYELNYRIFCGYYCVDKNKVVIEGFRSCD